MDSNSKAFDETGDCLDYLINATASDTATPSLFSPHPHYNYDRDYHFTPRLTEGQGQGQGQEGSVPGRSKPNDPERNCASQGSPADIPHPMEEGPLIHDLDTDLDTDPDTDTDTEGPNPKKLSLPLPLPPPPPLIPKPLMRGDSYTIPRKIRLPVPPPPPLVPAPTRKDIGIE